MCLSCTAEIDEKVTTNKVLSWKVTIMTMMVSEKHGGYSVVYQTNCVLTNLQLQYETNQHLRKLSIVNV